MHLGSSIAEQMKELFIIGVNSTYTQYTLPLLPYLATPSFILVYHDPLPDLRVHLQRNSMRTASFSRIIQLKPRIPKRAITLWLQDKLRYIALGAVEPAILDSHASALVQRDSSHRIISHFTRVGAPRVLVLVDGWFEAIDEECVRCLARECARRVFGGVGVNVEVDATDGGGHVAGHVEGDFGMDGVADFAGCLGAVGGVRSALFEGDDGVGEINVLELCNCSKSEENGKCSKGEHCGWKRVGTSIEVNTECVVWQT
jgi:hypothetical protein